MLIHNYHPVTGEYTGAGLADPSPLEPGQFLIPGYATTVEPPEPQEGFFRRFVDGAWGYSPIVAPETPPTPEPVPHVPSEISDRQFFQELANMELITEEEAEDAVASGVVPAAMLALVNLLPQEQRFPARMLLKGATKFERSHPITDTIGQMYGMDSAALDDLWRRASAL